MVKKIADKKIRLFISYSRRDFGKIEKLYEALSGDDELDVYLDQHDIAAAEEWKPRLEGLIRGCDTILFAVSPSSISSEVCQWELELAEKLNKRIIPIVLQDVPDGDVPKAIGKLNYIFDRNEDEFEPALASIDDALKIDVDWIREHTRLADMAHRWDQASKLGAQPLHGKDLERAEQWLSNQPKDAPAPTELQRKYIYESRKSATKRQRMTVMGSIAAMLIVGVLAGFAFVQRNAAIEGERKAEEALRSATQAANDMVFGLAQEFKDSSVPSNIIESILEKARKLQNALGENFEQDAELQRSKSAALSELGNLYLRLKTLDEARLLIEESLAIDRKLVSYDENNLLWQRDLLTSLIQIGDVKLHLGDGEGALKAYEESLEIHRKIVALQWFYTEWQRGMSQTLLRIGDVKLRKGDGEGAFKAYQEGLDVARKLATLDEDNIEWQIDRSDSLVKIGGVKLHLGDGEGALKAYQEGLEIRRKLVSLDENNTQWQVDLLANLIAIGDINLDAGERVGALKFYGESLAIARKLVTLDEKNTGWLRQLSISLERIGDVKLHLGDGESAFKAYEEGLEIFRRLVSLDESNTQWQRTLSVILNKIANVKLQAGDIASALDTFEESLAIRRKLIAFDENNTLWQTDMVRSYSLIAQADSTKFHYFVEALKILQRLNAQDKLSVEQIGWIGALEDEIAKNQ